jgi:hypothetical protein
MRKQKEEGRNKKVYHKEIEVYQKQVDFTNNEKRKCSGK